MDLFAGVTHLQPPEFRVKPKKNNFWNEPTHSNPSSEARPFRDPTLKKKESYFVEAGGTEGDAFETRAALAEALLAFHVGQTSANDALARR